ncbi:MAG: hypothetical protein JNL18_18570 [Planctomycetaceae bacterium]|nr:hypothetical protein [Planctomycetaceae bacterium]
MDCMSSNVSTRYILSKPNTPNKLCNLNNYYIQYNRCTPCMLNMPSKMSILYTHRKRPVPHLSNEAEVGLT